jgi:hypothetical protein
VAFLQIFQPIRKDIGSDFFWGILKISEVSLTEENKITNDKQRPFIAQYVQGTADWTGGTADLGCHNFALAYRLTFAIRKLYLHSAINGVNKVRCDLYAS